MDWAQAFATTAVLCTAFIVPGIIIVYRMHIVRSCDHDWAKIWSHGVSDLHPTSVKCLKCGVKR